MTSLGFQLDEDGNILATSLSNDEAKRLHRPACEGFRNAHLLVINTMQPAPPQFPFDDQTWIISDTHFFHENIGRYCDRPDGWQEIIIENWNSLIQPDEVIFHVGDLALGKRENIEGLVPLLNGKLYLMRGNHDGRGKSFYQRLGITLVPDPYPMNHPSGLRLVFSHRPIVPLESGLLNLHGHIHNSPAPELGARHVNVCVEVRGYRPWRLGEVLAPVKPNFE